MRRALDRAAIWVFRAAALLGVVLLAMLLVAVVDDGAGRLSWTLLTSFPSRFPEKAGIKSALVGSAWLMGFTALFSIPVGVGAAVYLEEFAPKNRLSRFIEVNISNLAGVPSIVYGILGLAVFVRWMALERSIVAGALTMSLLILPVIIVATREALRAVPNSIRLAALALGATRWQTIWHHVLPAALPGTITGVILAMSRALGEAAPMIMIGAFTYVAFLPNGPMDEFTVLPIQIFNWASRPQEEFQWPRTPPTRPSSRSRTGGPSWPRRSAAATTPSTRRRSRSRRTASRSSPCTNPSPPTCDSSSRR